MAVLDHKRVPLPTGAAKDGSPVKLQLQRLRERRGRVTEEANLHNSLVPLSTLGIAATYPRLLRGIKLLRPGLHATTQSAFPIARHLLPCNRLTDKAPRDKNSHKGVIDRYNKDPSRAPQLRVVHVAGYMTARARARKGGRHTDDDAVVSGELLGEIDLVPGRVLDENLEVRDRVSDTDGRGAGCVEGPAGDGGSGPEGGPEGEAGESAKRHFSGGGGRGGGMEV